MYPTDEEMAPIVKEVMNSILTTAKKNGLVFRPQPKADVGEQLFEFVNIETKEVILGNVSFWTAYEDVMDGKIELLMKEK